jgi:hypothetical protein
VLGQGQEGLPPTRCDSDRSRTSVYTPFLGRSACRLESVMAGEHRGVAPHFPTSAVSARVTGTASFIGLRLQSDLHYPLFPPMRLTSQSAPFDHPDGFTS